MAEENKSSPDLTHVRVVKAGDTLPLLTKAIYGSSRDYLRVAEHNGLDNFRDLTPGRRLVFPPLEQSRQ
jgi:nucleoid-associated protein YgaU